MDWSRAKTILIISFTLLNILLGYQLWVSWYEQNRGTVVHSQTVKELNQLLSAEQIELKDTLPMDLEKMGYLQIEVVQQDEDWQPLRSPVDVPPAGGNEEEVTEALQKQIKQLSAYELDQAAVADRQWIYYQLLGHFPVYVAPVELRRTGHQLDAYRQVHVKVTSRERTTTVVAPHAAVKSVVEAQLIPAGSVIEEVRLGYIGQLDAQEPQFLVPVWRIFTSGKDPLYVNALTGGLEADIWPTNP